jgi:hypothetical protein
MPEPPFNWVKAEIGCDDGGGGVRVDIGGSGLLQLAHTSTTRTAGTRIII